MCYIYDFTFKISMMFKMSLFEFQVKIKIYCEAKFNIYISEL